MKQRLEQIRKFLVENGLRAIKTLGPAELKLKADGTDLVKKVMSRKELMEKSNLVLEIVETGLKPVCTGAVKPVCTGAVKPVCTGAVKPVCTGAGKKEWIAKFSLHPEDKLRSQQLRNEILFYEKVAPRLWGRWEKMYPREAMPLVREYRNKTNKTNKMDRMDRFMAEKAGGENLGEAFELQNRKVNLAHLKRLVDFLFLVQELEVGEVQKMGIKLEKSPANYDDYLKMFKLRKKDLEKILKPDAIEKLSRELEIKEQFLRRGKEVFGNGEINCDGIYTTNKTDTTIKTDRTNKRKMIGVKIVDWDVLQKIGNPAGQFSYLVTALWPEPKLQQSLMDYIVQKGRSLYPGFDEYLRLDILLFRGTGILWRHYWRKSGRLPGFRKLKRWLEELIG